MPIIAWKRSEEPGAELLQGGVAMVISSSGMMASGAVSGRVVVTVLVRGITHQSARWR